MKWIILSAALLLFSCTSKKEYVYKQADKVLLDKGCPNDGKCEVKVIPNKTIVIKTAEFGELYYDLEDSADKIVIVYTYSKTVPKGLQDAGYREEVLFETPKDKQSSVISDNDLGQAKMLFGRFCYCKGSTGYYRIKNGNLKVDAAKESTVFTIDFKIAEVPQVLKQIAFTIK